MTTIIYLIVKNQLSYLKNTGLTLEDIVKLPKFKMLVKILEDEEVRKKTIRYCPVHLKNCQDIKDQRCMLSPNCNTCIEQVKKPYYCINLATVCEECCLGSYNKDCRNNLYLASKEVFNEI